MRRERRQLRGRGGEEEKLVEIIHGLAEEIRFNSIQRDPTQIELM